MSTNAKRKIIAAEKAGAGGTETLTQTNAGLLFGKVSATAGGTAIITSIGQGSFASGYAKNTAGAGTVRIRASAAGNFAHGYVKGGLIDVPSIGGFAQGFSSYATISAAQGGFAQGRAADDIIAGVGGFAQGDSTAGCAITAGVAGFAQGKAQGGAITAGIGGLAQGNATYAITAGDGGLAQGYAYAAAITASGDGSFAHGFTPGAVAIVASAQNSAQFGPGTNATADSLQVGSITGTAGVHLKATTNAIEAGDDLLVQTPANKTIKLDQVVWDDYVTPLGPNNWNGVSNNPTLTKLFDDGPGTSQGVYGYVYADGDEALITAQLPHRWKEGTTIYPHIHFMCTSDVDPTDKFGIEFEYAWADVGEDFPADSTLSSLDIDTGVNTDDMHQFANITAAGIDGTGHTISSVLLCRIKRIAGTSDNYAGGVAILDFDIHYEIDTIGSRQISTK